MTSARAGIRQLGRLTREHGVLLSIACTTILFLGYQSSSVKWPSIAWRNPDSGSNEAEIDSALQQAANDALGQREGTIIIMEAQTGRVRAIVNSQAAFGQALMPGSTMKPFTALAALRSGLIDENSRTTCPGRFTGLSFSLPCVHADHLPPFSPSQAIAYSCNYYFASLGQRLGRERLIETARQFGLGQPTGVSENEGLGQLRPCETGNGALVRASERNHVSGAADCLAREAIGESDHIQVTPIQLLAAYAALVNGGHLYEPRIASPSGFQKVERANLNVADQHRAIIIEGMAGAVRFGTARSAKLDLIPLEILGKTGTAEPANGFRTNGWFIGFAGPIQSTRQIDPEKIDLAVLVMVSHAHGSQAAALAKPIFEIYANELSHIEASSPVGSNVRTPSAVSRIRVHLVTENSTEELSLEDYVLGVMRAEGSAESEPEALKALAIAIRTYALRNNGRHAKDGYDFCSTTHCQRFARAANYTGAGGPEGNAPHPLNRASEALWLSAVRATEGQVLRDERNQLVDSYFGASCGGETANIGTLWGITPAEYLRGVRDEYCLTGPHATWNDAIKRDDLLRAISSDARTDVGNRLDQIVVTKRDETGRAEFVTLQGERRKTVRGWDFKIIVGRILGWNLIKSSRFEVAREGSTFIFRGSGFGHGLGLCQEGAHVMATRGASYQKILEKYFPGTHIANEERIAITLSTNQRRDLTAEGAENFAEGAEKNPLTDENSLCVSLRKAQRPLRFRSLRRLNSSQVWNSDLLIEQTGYQNFEHSILKRSEKYLTISSEHFRITYPVDVDRRDADQVLNTLESSRTDFLQRAAAASILISSLPTLEIRLNASTGDFTARTGQPWWAAAATKGNRLELQPIAILKRRAVLTSTLRHELAHAVIDVISKGRAPRWLAEGFAISLAGEGSAISRYETNSRLTTEELETNLQHPRSQQEMRSLYAQAYAKVAEIIRRDGEASIWRELAAK